MPLYLSEADVAEVLEPLAAVEAIEACFRRLGAGEVVNAPRRRLRLRDGSLADMAASALGLGLAGGKLYVATPERAVFVVCLFDAASAELVAVIEADHLGRLRTGAASGVAARHLALAGASTLGVLGCGHQAETQVACIRAAVPSLERVVAYCRTDARHLGLGLVAAAEDTECAGTGEREVARGHAARSARPQAAEVIGLDYGDELGAHGVEEADDEGRALGSGDVELASGEAEAEVGRGHVGQGPLPQPQPTARRVHHDTLPEALEAALDRLHRGSRVEHLRDIRLGQVQGHCASLGSS